MSNLPTQLGDYLLEVEICRCEWGLTYRGRRGVEEAPLLITVVSPLFATDEIFVRRFKLLTAQNASLEHPNLLPTAAAEEVAETLLVTQPFIEESRSLAQAIVAEGPFSTSRTQRITAQIAAALDHAHHHGVWHGHLSAERIYLGPQDHVWLTDFGISHLVSGPNLARHGLPGRAVETLAPERVQGQGPSRQADLYALGVLCYQMLAQQPPFHGPVSTVLHGHAYRQPRPLHRLDPGIPLAMSEAVGRMLAKSVEVRYHTGAEFVRAMAVAERRRSGSAPFDHLLPLADRERRRGPSAKVLLYFPVALVLTVLVTGLAVWAGYELAQQQFSRAIPTPRIIVVTRPAPVETPLIGHSEAATAPTIAVSKSATPEPLVVLSDRLQPTVPRPTPSPSPTPANPVVEVAFNPSPELPSQQGQFVFYNPTGYDLIVDLTGPTPASLLVPPGGQEEILLQPGRYQVILHTPTGTGLSSKVGTFTVNGGQVMTQDYYSESYETVQ